MFDLKRQLRGEEGVVATEGQQATREQKQRDVYETHRHRVFSVSYYMTANELEAENILTDTFVEAFANSAEPDAHGVDCALLGELKRRFSLQRERPAEADGGNSLAKAQVRRTDLEEAVATLPSRERLVFLLMDVEGYSCARIADLLGCEQLDVHQTLISARIRMRNALAGTRKRKTLLVAQRNEGHVKPAECA